MTAAPDLAAWLRDQYGEFLEAAQDLGISGEAVARCEAELAILEEHALIGPSSRGGPICNTCVDITIDPADAENFYVPYPCRTVRLLGSGYRHRDGYLRQWAP